MSTMTGEVTLLVELAAHPASMPNAESPNNAFFMICASLYLWYISKGFVSLGAYILT